MLMMLLPAAAGCERFYREVTMTRTDWQVIAEDRLLPAVVCCLLPADCDDDDDDHDDNEDDDDDDEDDGLPMALRHLMWLSLGTMTPKWSHRTGALPYRGRRVYGSVVARGCSCNTISSSSSSRQARCTPDEPG